MRSFDPQDPDFLQNPYPTYAALHERQPVFFHEGSGMWFFIRHADVDFLLRDRRLGRAIDHVLPRAARGVPPPPAELAPFTRLGANSLMDKEPPDHTRLKLLVHKAFTPRRVSQMRDDIDEIARELLAAVEPHGRMELLENFAVPLPVQVIARLLGVPRSDEDLLRPWSQDIVAMYELAPPPGTAERAVAAAEEFADYLRRLAAARRQAPQDDLITALAFAEEAGEQLTEDELVSTCVLLLNAGHEATVNVIGNGLWALLRHPDQMARLQQEPQLLLPAIEEMMRFDSPLQMFRRWVLADFDFGGVALRTGMQVGLIYGAANWDPAVFDRPERFDIGRQPNPHLTFGAGIHYCLGAPLARLELEIAIRHLFTRLPNLRLAGDPPRFRDKFVLRGLENLEVTFGSS